MYKEATGEVAAISQEDIDTFKRGIDPLVKYGKLGALLAQFPPSFRNDSFGQQIIKAVSRAFREYRLAVELRHRSWSDDSGIATFLRENCVALVQIDEPKFKSSVAEELPTTSDMAYFRFHGRNTETWWTGDSETRYKYLYSADEIAELAHRVKSAREQTTLLFAMFNNHWRGYAPRNATELMNSLQLPLKEPTIQGKLKEDEFAEES
jgi:uncharacterized protein YecE (DUF72 family)